MTTENRELFELCKQVYEATGWENDPYIKHLNKAPKYEHRYGNASIYTSDYLLEKLPSPLIFHNNDCAIEVRRTKKDKYMWSANIRHSYGQFFKQLSDTPLKALLKLCLALHKEGVL